MKPVEIIVTLFAVIVLSFIGYVLFLKQTTGDCGCEARRKYLKDKIGLNINLSPH